MSLRLGVFALALLPGIVLTVRPVSRVAAQLAALELGDTRQSAIDAGKTEAEAAILADDAYNRSLARSAITGWDGDITDGDGNAAPVTDANVDLLMGVAEINRAFVEKYVDPFLAEVLEKNASAPSSTGTTLTTAAPTADGASNDQGSDSATDPQLDPDSPPPNAPS